MDVVSQRVLLAALAIAVGGALIISRGLGPKQNPREPPVLAPGIPYIGHAIGLLRSKFNYYLQLSQQCHLPIFTMMMPGQKMYVVTTPELIQAIQKQPRVLAFPPIEARFTTAICGTSEKAYKVLMVNINGDEGDRGLFVETHAAMKEVLAPSPQLDEMINVMIQDIAASFDALKPSAEQPKRMRLASWMRSVLTAATTDAIYGPQNPFKEQEVEDGFWHFVSSLMTFVIGLFPSITARKGVAGRARVAEAFEEYFTTGGHKQGSVVIQKRFEVSSKYGISIGDTARYTMGGALALVVNTAPAAFWILFFVYSCPGLLEELRKEVDQIVTTQVDESGGLTRSFDISSLKTRCPLLASTFQEVLRYTAIGTSVRQVMEDTVLDNQWLLKKGAMVQMPTRIIHRDSSVWGTDVDTFNPRRFMKGEPQKTDHGKRPNPAAFRAFGGGTTLCPGRHFATTEVLAVVTMFVMRYEMAPVAGKWSMPKTDNTSIAAVIMEPDIDIEVEVSTREGSEHGRWAFGLKDSGKVFAVVAEDRSE
ncbi:hypothetical protein MMC30_001925 [Trapelia coarctata]|nr:hypothetical protein [Trapelia coarctata]